MKVELGTPNEKQKLFLKDKHKHVGYGGARGGGKSWAIRYKAKLLAANYPGIKMLIVRRTYPELTENHIVPLRQELQGIAKYNGTDKKFTFKNNSTIKFMYCKADQDVDALQGQEYDVIFLDEATQLSEYQIKAITATCRGANSYPKRIYYTMNPGGQGHGYIKRLFITREYGEGEYPEEYSFTQAKATDNDALMQADPDYIRQLEALPPKIREAWLNGSWDIYEGQFFEEFRDDPEHYEDHRWTHVIEPFDIPAGWTIYRSYDFGYSRPFSFGWWAVDEDDTAYRILELYGCTKTPNEGVKWTADEQFKKAKEIETTHPWLKGKHIHGVADPAIWEASHGESIEETAMRYQLYFDKGDNKRIPGWMQMHYRLSFDVNGYAKMYFFKNCKAIIRCMPLMMYDETHVEDLDTTLEDHCLDDARYFCMTRPIAPRKAGKVIELKDDPLNMTSDMLKNRRSGIKYY